MKYLVGAGGMVREEVAESTPQAVFAKGRRPVSSVERDLENILRRTDSMKDNLYDMDKKTKLLKQKSEDLIYNYQALLRARFAATTVVFAIRWKRKALAKAKERRDRLLAGPV